MVLTVHHLGHSQSDRIVWLCEELGIPYELKKYDRSPLLSPPKYIALHPIGAAPVITDSDADLTLAESAACADYIIHIFGGGRLAVKPGAKNYADYLYWFAFANGTLQPAIGRCMALRFAGISEENNTYVRYQNKVDQSLKLLDQRLGKSTWLAGEEFTAADVMTVWSLTGMREFYQFDISEYANVLAYLQRVNGREAWLRAREKGDPDVDTESLLQGPSPLLFKALRK
ncbi:putative glutathione S-transferase [Neohortaea acidophila]|uniref:Putative glutathione S-transferase n=1 Tax=Neohortaea acidophila TaxID=245834 RepID=A0A6A6PTZ8_9PEZI|nr:putative glutathione S-transferase [Neohortaea acidophila]KAF2483236.1 putative glutathione S-transferase [Neohortaea acidophila]